MSPDDDEWHKYQEAETKRLEEKERHEKAVAIAVVVTALIGLTAPSLLYLILFFVAWTHAMRAIKKIKSRWIRLVVYVLVAAVLLAALLWFDGELVMAFLRGVFRASPSDE
jgi:H+/Cl- antiporter ClcA